jgi:hypothetical protein
MGLSCYVADVPIVGERPQTGVRIAIERPRTEGPPWEYGGTAALPDALFPVRVTVSEIGDVDVALSLAQEPDAETRIAPPADLAEKIRLIVRAVYRQAKSDGEPPAFRIVRWRADR